MITQPWNPDVEVAVHDGELIVKLDHLPEVSEHRFAADVNGGEVLVRSESLHDGTVDHALHLLFEGHREYDYVLRHGFAEAGGPAGDDG